MSSVLAPATPRSAPSVVSSHQERVDSFEREQLLAELHGRKEAAIVSETLVVR